MTPWDDSCSSTSRRTSDRRVLSRTALTRTAPRLPPRGLFFGGAPGGSAGERGITPTHAAHERDHESVRAVAGSPVADPREKARGGPRRGDHAAGRTRAGALRIGPAVAGAGILPAGPWRGRGGG